MAIDCVEMQENGSSSHKGKSSSVGWMDGLSMHLTVEIKRKKKKPGRIEDAIDDEDDRSIE